MTKKRWRIVATAACVAAAGLAGAWPFRRSQPPSDLAPTPRAASQVVWREESERAATSLASAAAEQPADQGNEDAPVRPPASLNEQRNADNTQIASAPPPSLATSYQSAAVSPKTVESHAAPPAENASQSPQASSLRWRRHKIKDGDTLAKLAQIYLDDPAREMEIFQSNRHVLQHPEILPIGKWLRIPPLVRVTPPPVTHCRATTRRPASP